jgi:hypothetical protein
MMARIRGRAWWYLVLLAAIIGLFGVGDIVGGASVDPGIALAVSGRDLAGLEAESAAAYRMFDFTTRTQGWNLFVIGLLALAVLLVPYRAGRGWAWSVMWSLPLWCFGVAGLYLAYGLEPGQPLPPPLVSGPFLGVIAAAVLLVDRRRFRATEPRGARHPEISEPEAAR